MARILVLVKNNNGRRGEVVAVKPDGHVWGRKEVPPNFEQIDLNGVDPAKLMDLLEPDLDAENDDAFVARRKVKIDDISLAKKSRNERELRDRLVSYRSG